MWRKSAPWLAFAVGGTAALAGIGWFSADLVAERLYVHWRPQLERQLTAAFGHPLEIGAFGGIGWSGLLVGPTRVLPHAGDPSSLRIRRMGISLDLISSLRRRLPVLQLNLNGLDLDLRRNAAGGYWRFGRVPADQVPPKLDLRLRLGTPGRVRLSEAGLDLAIRGGATIHPHQSALSGWISLGATGQAEAPLQLAGGGQWNEQRWRGTLVSRRLDLAQLHRTLGLPGQLTGKADGRLQLAADLAAVFEHHNVGRSARGDAQATAQRDQTDANRNRRHVAPPWEPTVILLDAGPRASFCWKRQWQNADDAD